MATNRPKPAPRRKFKTLGGGNQIQWAELNGALLAISPMRIERGIRSEYGGKDVVVAHIVVIDGEHAGDQYQDAMVFPIGLFGQLKNELGELLLVRLGQGNPVKDEDGDIIYDDSGQPKRPWKFIAATDEDYDVAEAFEAARKPRAV